MKIETADTITDEQIRELRDRSATDALYQGWNIRGLCAAALKLYGPDRSGTRATARARCAEILKARAMETNKKFEPGPSAKEIAKRDTFPTSKLTPGEVADGWVLCDDPTCKPTMGKRRVVGSHAHRANGGAK